MTVAGSSGPRSAGRVLLLTGRPGVGKTTILRQVASRVEGRSLAGFYTEEIRSPGGRRQGFRIVTFDGKKRIMAHVDLPGPVRIGRYGVDLSAIDRAVEETLVGMPRGRLYLIDEIGRMECLSTLFRRTTRQLLGSGERVLATVAARGGGFIAEVKGRPGVEVWEVTRASRAVLPVRVLEWLELP